MTAEFDSRLHRAIARAPITADTTALVDEAMARIERERQRPAITVPGWWVPEGANPGGAVRRVAVPVLVASVLLATIVGIGLTIVGMQPRLPAPFGPARTGSLVYSAGGDLWLLDIESGTTRSLTSEVGSEWGPVWSRDGRFVAFWSSRITPRQLSQACGDRVGNAVARCGFDTKMMSGLPESFGLQTAADLVVMDIDAQTRRVIATGLTPTGPVDWSPDSQRLALSSMVDGSSRVFITRRDAAGLDQITGPDLQASWPAWAPDGQTIAVRGGASDAERGVYLMGPDGSDVRLITHVDDLGDPTAFRATWSPDGRHLAFFAGYGSTYGSYVVDADGAGQQALTPLDAVLTPRWSPDGRHVAVVAGAGTSNATIYVVEVDDPDPDHVVAVQGMVDYSAPEWSPDGRWLYGSATSGGAATSDDRVLLLDPSGVAPAIEIPVLDGGGTGSWRRLAP